MNTFLSSEKLRKIGFKPKYKTSREVIMHAIESTATATTLGKYEKEPPATTSLS